MSKANGASLIDLQIMWHRLIAVVEEQAQVLLRTAFSPIVRECGDLSAGVFDLKGRMLAQAVTGTPGHVNSMAESVKHFIDRFPIETMKEGDAYITTDPDTACQQREQDPKQGDDFDGHAILNPGAGKTIIRRARPSCGDPRAAGRGWPGSRAPGTAA